MCQKSTSFGRVRNLSLFAGFVENWLSLECNICCVQVLRNTICFSYLKMTITPNSEIPKHEFVRVFTAVYRGSNLGVEVALRFFMNNYNAMAKR